MKHFRILVIAGLTSLLFGYGSTVKAQDCPLPDAPPTTLDTVVVVGYRDVPTPIIIPIADSYANTPPMPTSGPGGKYSATPNTHTVCADGVLAKALSSGSASSVSTPTNTALAIPMRYQNPIDISNNSPVGKTYGGTNGTAGFMVFANLAAGTNASVASIGNYAQNALFYIRSSECVGAGER